MFMEGYNRNYTVPSKGFAEDIHTCIIQRCCEEHFRQGDNNFY